MASCHFLRSARKQFAENTEQVDVSPEVRRELHNLANINNSAACFPVLPLRCALIHRELNQIFIACLFKGSQEQSFFLQTLLFTAFLVTVLKNVTYAFVST